MKKTIFAFAVTAMLCAACGGSVSLTPSSTNINGPLGDYFEIVDRDYTVNDGCVNVEFKRISEGGPTTANYSSAPTLTIEYLDETGNVISSESTNAFSSTTNDQLESVFALSVGESSSVSFDFNKVKGAVEFKISSKLNESDESVESSSSDFDEDDEDDEDDDDEDIDEDDDDDEDAAAEAEALIKEYGQFIDSYISILKKVKNGDISALAESASLLEKAQDLQDKLEDVDLTDAQEAAFAKLVAKLSKAAAE